jgi:hypothetical protein
MAMGSYFLGSDVKIPVMVQVNGIPLQNVIPTIDKIILPNGISESGFPQTMIPTHSGSSTYYYNYTPKVKGDYIVLIHIVYNDVLYTTIENFTINDNVLKIATKKVPKAVAS